MLTIAIIAIFLLISISIGYIAARHTSTGSLKDLFVANKSLGLIALVMALFGGQITAFGILGAPGTAYQLGFSTFGYLLGIAPFGILIGFYLIGYRTWVLTTKFDYITPVDFFAGRFEGNIARYVIGVLQIFLEIPYILICGIGAGAILVTVTDGLIPYWLGSLVILLVATYTAYSGGMRGAAWTNIFQGILMFAVLFIMMITIFRSMGGTSGLLSKISNEMISMSVSAPERALGRWLPYSFLATGISNGVVMHQLSRNMSANSAKNIKRNIVIFPILYAIFFFMALSLGVWGKVLIPGLSAQECENIIPLLAERFAPIWMVGMVGAGVLAAILTSWDGMILTTSSIFSEDFIKPIFKSKGVELTEEQDTKLSKMFIIILGIITYILTLLQPATILNIAIFSFSGFACLAPSYIAALYWKRTTKWGVVVSSIVSVFFEALWAFKILPEWTTFGTHYVFPGFILAIVLVIVVSLLTEPAPAERVNEFFSVFDEVYGDK